MAQVAANTPLCGTVQAGLIRVTSPVAPVVHRFGDFELDLGAYELRRQGRRVKMGKQPMDLLILLVQRPRQLVTRGEIAERLWGPDVFVDIETGVNTAISKIRQALRDSSDAPAFVETVPGKGYRFIALVEVVNPDTIPGSGDEFFRTLSSGGSKLVLGSADARKDKLDTVFRTALVIKF